MPLSSTTPIQEPVTHQPPFADMVWIPGGTFQMGSNDHYPEEKPAHPQTVSGFWIDKYAVTNEQFARFVDETKYVTMTERPVNPDDYPGVKIELLQPASVVFSKPAFRVDINNHFNWWSYITGANWRHPEGPESNIDDRAQHPVVHVGYEDVEAYAAWVGKALPAEAEWEFAARGGLDGAAYAWGEELTPRGKIMANNWQGEFPWQNLKTDGYERTAPIGQYPPNGYGLYDMIGNVWEWTTDWYTNQHLPKACCGGRSAKGIREQSYDPSTPNIHIPRRVIKGGSFLCAPNYCRRYRPAARMAQAIDTAACHLGFRLIVRRNNKNAATNESEHIDITRSEAVTPA